MRLIHLTDRPPDEPAVGLCGVEAPRYVTRRPQHATCDECLKLSKQDLEGRFLFDEVPGKDYLNMTWWCPGCDRPHTARVTQGERDPYRYLSAHAWCGSRLRPTLSPCWFEYDDTTTDMERFGAESIDVCHCFIRKGLAQFGGGPHGKANQTLSPPVFAEAYKTRNDPARVAYRDRLQRRIQEKKARAKRAAEEQLEYEKLRAEREAAEARRLQARRAERLQAAMAEAWEIRNTGLTAAQLNRRLARNQRGGE